MNATEIMDGCYGAYYRNKSKIEGWLQGRGDIEEECKQAAKEQTEERSLIPKENKKGYVIELKKQGLKTKEIALLTNCSEAYVRKILSEFGMSCENYVKISPELKEKALHMLRNGSTDYDVSIALKIKLESVRTWRRNILGITYQRGAAGHINNNKQR